MIDIAGFTLPWAIVVVGICSGFAYGLLGVGLVLVHRSSRFINFAHSQIGAFGAALMAILVINGHLPYWVALPLGMTAAAGIGSLVEVSVVRRLSRAPRLMSMVATLGVGQFLFFVSLVMNAQATSASFFPVPTGMPTFTVSGLLIGQDATGILILGPLSVLALTLFFRRSRYGLAIRGAAANPDAAAMAGMSPRRLTNMSWAIAGALACMTAALLIPSLGALAGAALGPTLLLRALVAAVVGRMRGLAATFFAGMAIGLLDRVVMYKQPSKAGLSDVILLGAVLVSLLLQGRPGRREEEKGAWLAVRPWPALPEAMHRVWLIRHLGLVVAVPALVVAVVVPSFLTPAHSSVLAQFGALVVVGLSLSIITGLGGQLSLGQFAIGGAGAAAAIATASSGGSVLLPLLVGTLVGAAVSVVIGMPALRVHGLLFAVATLAFALAMRGYILKQPSPLGFGQSTVTTGPTLLGHPIDDGRVQAYLAIAAVVLALLVARNVFASSFGRLLVALRDNEDAARAFTVSPPRRKLQAYAVAGGFAGLGGALFAFTQTVVSAGTFAADTSIVVTVIVVVGGTGLVAGPLLGAALAYPTLINVDPAVSGTITLAWLLLILYHPNGIPGLLRPVRGWLLDGIARMAGVDPVAARADADPARAVTGPPTTRLATATPREATTADVGSPLLVASGLEKRYGGLRAVNGVDLTVQRGEVLGLVGPNGAGKTTLFECLSGFVGIDSGSITFDGSDITRWSPERRARAGLIRSFQDSALFATLTVLETTMVAAEGAHPSRLASALGGWSRSDRLRESRARELLDLFGLDRYRHTEVGALSTGTRRIAELACLVSLEPKLLLLDEPSSGVAQAEVEAMGQVLVNVRRHLDATLVIIEHDLPLISSIADRMVAMETGSVLAIGTPREVLDDPAVVESYLGGDPTAVHRSAAPTPALVTTSSSPSLGA
jgi:ABC-type branched-subunit amino acid transport system ATPase component/ABC-type branched-subunit amino acid transport system permease subunit